MAALPEVDVTTVLAYRVARSGLLRGDGLAELSGWELGFQDRSGSSRLAVGIRLRDAGELPDAWADPDGSGDHVLGWTVRGGVVCAHRRADLPALTRALWPADADTAAVFLQAEGARLVERGIDPLDALTQVRDAMREVVTGPMSKGAVSAAITARVDADLSSWCQRCGSTHVVEGLFRTAALPAGIGAVPDSRPVIMTRYLPGLLAPDRSAGIADLVAACYRLYGCASATEVGWLLGFTGRFVTPVLPDGLVSVRVAGHRALAHPDLLATDLPDNPPARLLPTADPILQSRDRATLVPDPAARKELWPALGAPGAILADGSIAGTWRGQLSSGRLSVTLRPWHRLSRTVLARLRDEAQLVASIRGAADVRVTAD